MTDRPYPGPVTALVPGADQAMHAVADRLTACGLDVRGPAWEECQRLTITNITGVFCELSVYAGGHVIWDYQPLKGHRTDPATVTAMVMRILGADSAGQAIPLMRPLMSSSLTDVVSSALSRYGLEVCPAAFNDQPSSEAYADIEATNPARQERGRARVTREGAISWEMDLSHNAGGTIASISETIVNALSRA